MIDREQMEIEMQQQECDWRPLNRRQEAANIWVEVLAILGGLSLSVAFWEGLAWLLKVMRHV